VDEHGVGLGQRFTLRQELDRGIVDREVPAERAGAAGLAGPNRARTCRHSCRSAAKKLAVCVSAVSTSENEMVPSAVSVGGARHGIERDLVHVQAAAVIAIG